MSDHISLLKARYCSSILKMASRHSDVEATHLCNSLATERATGGTSPPVTNAEEAALEAIYALVIRLGHSNFRSSPIEVSHAAQAIDQWVAVAQ
ncbi:hypothetical protein RPMA_13020 [Tardiphaga alba]|uniref:Uncharacterized protein n=1 Tax=Tardiphaga alba TaxID=340268 RepID=A0ABX8A7M3_9BRAD|nr:hypothetical protein [Tardiphaga alba]QUS39658.1 hypothetical protein RPMA_13020 [Tardiphaga alba]